VSDSPLTDAAREKIEAFVHDVRVRPLLPKSMAEALTDFVSIGRVVGDSYPQPLPPDNRSLLSADAAEVATLLLADLLPGRQWATGNKDLDEIRLQIKAFQLSQLLEVHDAAQTAFSKRAKMLAFLPGLGLLRIWHTLMLASVTTHIIQQALLGGRSRIVNAANVQRALDSESVYLARFAGQITETAKSLSPMTEAAIASRSRTYSGTGRAIFYTELESLPWGYGFVAEYTALDDNVTCHACKEAGFDPLKLGGVRYNENAYYRLGGGPMPGIICWGRDHCRCRRVVRNLPEVWRLLNP